MISPEEALAEARRRAAERGEAEGGASSDESPLTAGDSQRDALKRLADWAMIEPDEGEVYSTRRLGAPVTFLKRRLIRLLNQYLLQITAQQSRFNANVLAHLVALDERVRALEEAAASEKASDELPRP